MRTRASGLLRWAALAAALLACHGNADHADHAETPAAIPGSLCITQTVGHGQNTVSLWCGQDSCISARFAHNNYAPLRVGWYSGRIDAAKLREGISLVRDVLGKSDWVHNFGSATFTVTLDDTLKKSVSRHPENGPRLQAIDAWNHARLDSTAVNPVWSDSLVVAATSGGRAGKGTLEIFLSSGQSREKWFGRGAALKISYATRTPTADNTEPPTNVDALDSCARQVITGGKCVYRLPKGAHSLRAILRGAPAEGTLPSGKSCLEGRFELVSEWTAAL